MWKSIDGYFYPYRIDEMGNVERESKPGVWTPLKPFVQRDRQHDNGHGRICIRMKTPEGK